MWINRQLQEFFREKKGGLSLFPIWLLLGPRQVGKSSLLQYCKQEGRGYLTLDDLETRQRANQDPIAFIKQIRLPIIIDEIQYAPLLLSALKEKADKKVPAGSIWLTGSQNFEVMRGVRESLAGRVALINLFGLTDEEKNIGSSDFSSYFNSMLESGFPKIFGLSQAEERSFFLSNYVQTYIERDIVELLGIQKRREFELFVRAAALRSGQLINYDDLSRDCHIAPATAREWTSLLEDSFLIKIIHPWHSNQTKRLIKTPKFFFLDTGLLAHLVGWRTVEQLAEKSHAGSVFETQILSNLYRSLKHRLKTFEMFFFRNKDGEEIDCLFELGGKYYVVEVKLGKPQKITPLTSIGLPKIERAFVVSLSDPDKSFKSSVYEWKKPNEFWEVLKTL